MLQFIPVGGTLGTILLYASFAALLAFGVLNIRAPGFVLILIGLALNAVVIVANQGMPVTRNALERSNQSATLSELIANGGAKHHLADANWNFSSPTLALRRSSFSRTSRRCLNSLLRTPVKHVVVASMGDMLGRIKGTLVNTVVRHVKKMVPAYSLPDSIKFNDVLAAGRQLKFIAPTART